MKIASLQLIKAIVISGQERNRFRGQEFTIEIIESIIKITDLRSNEICLTSTANLHMAYLDQEAETKERSAVAEHQEQELARLLLAAASRPALLSLVPSQLQTTSQTKAPSAAPAPAAAVSAKARSLRKASKPTGKRS
jgi:hypothetical protein